MSKDKDIPTPEDLGLPTVEIPDETTNENEQKPQEETQPPPRRRGRPRKDGSTGPASERPKKSNSRKTESAEALARQIMGLHQVALLATGIPECQITEQESVILATALNAVVEEYGLSLSGKTGAALQLFGAAAIVYGPRIISIQQRNAQAKKKKAEEENMIVDVDAFMGPNNGTPNY